jgi:ubiquinone/menaquinone biosynthesis C-methylase UbiE
MTASTTIWYGANVADDGELRLCGDLAGKRAIELGIGSTSNAVALAEAGARAIAVDPRPAAISAVRAAAEAAEVTVQCHQSELADLGFATSASVDLVVSSHSLDSVDDMPRLLRQVHRVLKPGASFVVAITHPVAAMFEANDPIPRRAYGEQGLTFGDLYMAFERTNFRADAMHELTDRRTRDALTPSVLVLRARKQGV